MRNMLQLTIRLLCMAAFLWIAPGGIGAQDVEWNVWDGSTIATGFGGGNGDSESDPYLITSGAELAYLAQQVNKQYHQGGSNYAGKYFKFTKNIDLNNQEWIIIGSEDGGPFNGIFDGNKKTIKNLKVTKSYSGANFCAGLFGSLQEATIKQITVIISEEGIRGVFAGGITGKAYKSATIENCCVLGGPIDGYIYYSSEVWAGGIIGMVSEYDNHHVTVRYCCVNVSSITATLADPSAAAETYAGGIIGGSSSDENPYVQNCLSFTREIKAITKTEEAGRYLGGILASSSSNISNNYSNPSCIFTQIDYEGKIETSTVTNGTDQNGAALTPDNLNANGALAGWEAQGWELSDNYLPKISSSAPTTPYNLFSGTGTSGNPYLLASSADLVSIANQINNGVAGFNNNEYYKLTNDFNLSTQNWTPIGTASNPFKGTFDGNNKTITFSIKADANQAQAGLFGTIDATTKVDKLAVHITADGITSTTSGAPSNAGAIAAINKGTIDQCYVTGEGFILSTDGTDNYAGGIAGKNEGTISNSYNLIPVKVNDATSAYFGGIAGYNTGTIEYCFAAGEVGIAENTVISSISVGDEKAGGIAGFNDHLNAGVVRNCLAVNTLIPTNAHRVIGTGADADDVNNFSFREMPRLITKSTDAYDPLEGTPLTKDNLNSNAGGCFNGWDVAAWNLDNITTHLPKIQGFADTQHNKEIAPYLLYTVTIGAVTNGTLSVTRPDPISSSTTDVNTGDQVPYDTQLTITATPDAKYELDQLLVNGTAFTSGSTYAVKDNVTISATFKEISDPTPKPDPDPTPKPDPAPVYYTVTLPAVEGVITDPVAGEYQVEGWSTFRFYLTLDPAYDKSVPLITTDRSETIKPLSSDGAYLVKYVRSDVQIFIDGIVKNPSPVANESVESPRPKIWRTNNYLHMQSPTAEQAYIYTPDGKLQTSCKLLPGEVKRVWLPSGIYFIRIGKERGKVTIDN